MSEKAREIFKVDNKYEIHSINNWAEIELYRNGLLWEVDPKYSKMFVSIAYKLEALKNKTEQVRVLTEAIEPPEDEK